MIFMITTLLKPFQIHNWGYFVHMYRYKLRRWMKLIFQPHYIKSRKLADFRWSVIRRGCMGEVDFPTRSMQRLSSLSFLYKYYYIKKFQITCHERVDNYWEDNPLACEFSLYWSDLRKTIEVICWIRFKYLSRCMYLVIYYIYPP